MSPSYQLYTYFRSSCSARVRIALNWKNIEYSPKFVNLLHHEQNAPDFINPNHRVPVLVLPDGTTTITQSIAILEYLEEMHPEKPLLPKDALLRAQVREIVNLISCDIQPIQNLGVLRTFPQHERNAWGQKWVERGFDALEVMLAKTAGEYCVGDQVTLADVCLVPQVVNAMRFNVDITKYPMISAIYANLVKLDAFEQAAWYNQPDCPQDLRKK